MSSNLADQFPHSQRRLIGYALAFLIANYDEEDVGEDLNMSEEEVHELALATGFVEKE